MTKLAGARGNSLEVRLAEASRSVAGYYAQWVDELSTRDHLVLEMADSGYSHGQVARAAGITPQRVLQIIAKVGAEPELV